MRIITFIDQTDFIEKILTHLKEKKGVEKKRAGEKKGRKGRSLFSQAPRTPLGYIGVGKNSQHIQDGSPPLGVSTSSWLSWRNNTLEEEFNMPEIISINLVWICVYRLKM